jgi:maltoporin
MNLKYLALLSVFVCSAALGADTVATPEVEKDAAKAADMDDGQFVGYLRVGAGVSQHGGPQDCYYLGNGDGHGYRLGNECDSFTEFGYAKTLARSEDGMGFIGHIMVSDYSPDSAYSSHIQISQIFFSSTPIEALNGGTPWLGERYYERPDIHWMDLQYINLNGTGGGIDNIGTPWGGKFSYAIFKDDDTSTYTGTSLSTAFQPSNSAIRNDFLYRDLPVNPGGALDFVFGVIAPSTPSSDRFWGYNLHLFHKQNLWGGGNVFGVQYGEGPGTGRGAPNAFNPAAPNAAFGGAGGVGANAICCNRMGQAGSTLLGPSDTRLRIFDAIWIQPTTAWGAGFDLLYQGDKSPVYGGGTSNWFSAGVRPEYAISRHFKLQAEVGVDSVSYPGAPTENLLKYTLAPTFTLGPGFFDRPELRFFVTRANWNTASVATINSNNPTPTVGSITSDTSFGIQVEAWWAKPWY